MNRNGYRKIDREQYEYQDANDRQIIDQIVEETENGHVVSGRCDAGWAALARLTRRRNIIRDLLKLLEGPWISHCETLAKVHGGKPSEEEAERFKEVIDQARKEINGRKQ